MQTIGYTLVCESSGWGACDSKTSVYPIVCISESRNPFSKRRKHFIGFTVVPHEFDDRVDAFQRLQHLVVGRWSLLRVRPLQDREVQLIEQELCDLITRVRVDLPSRDPGDLLTDVRHRAYEFAGHPHVVGRVDLHPDPLHAFVHRNRAEIDIENLSQPHRVYTLIQEGVYAPCRVRVAPRVPDCTRSWHIIKRSFWRLAVDRNDNSLCNI